MQHTILDKVAALNRAPFPIMPTIAQGKFAIGIINNIDIFRKYMTKKLRKMSVEYLWAYSQAILKSLKIVWIPLKEGKDDPQAIFESLNAKGTNSLELDIDIDFDDEGRGRVIDWVCFISFNQTKSPTFYSLGF